MHSSNRLKAGFGALDFLVPAAMRARKSLTPVENTLEPAAEKEDFHGSLRTIR